MAIDDLDTLERKLAKRGFRREDGYVHVCSDCNEQAMIKYVLANKTGGRDISLCQACGKSRSWRSGAGFQTREEDAGFDLRAFLT